MKYLKVFVVSVLLIIVSSCSTTFNVVHIQDNIEMPKRNGVYYALPQNYITIDITITETEKIKGPFANYANKYLGLKNVLLSNTSTYEISDIKIGTYSAPDPEQFYFVELTNNSRKRSNDILLELSEAGLIQNLNDKSEIASQENMVFVKDADVVDYSKTFKYFADANLYEQVDTVIELVNLDTITIEKKILKRRLVEKSLEQKAKEAADFIMRTKENRFNIITGYQEVPYEKGTVQYMYEELEKLENDYMKLFTGMTVTRTLNYRYTYLPESNVFSASQPLFKFSKKHGIVKAGHPYGEMVYIQIDRQRNTQKLESFVNKMNEELKDKKKGFYYRIPEYAKFTIKQGITLKAEASFLISQFGVVTYLPVKKSKIKYYPKTGAIKSVGVE
jgi:hypothetical protein